MNYNKAANWPTFKSINRHYHRMSPGLPTRTSSPSRAPRIDEHSLSKSSILTLPPMPTARNGNPTQFDSDPSMRFTALGCDYGPSQGQLELTSDHYRHQQHQEEGNQQHALVLVWHERWWNRNLDGDSNELPRPHTSLAFRTQSREGRNECRHCCLDCKAPKGH